MSIVLYGCTIWTLTKCIEKKLDGNYTWMLRAIFNKSWRQQPTKQQLYGHSPPITKTIKVRRTRHAGHCRSKDELISDVLLWTPSHGLAKAGRPARTYIQQLCADTGYSPEDLPKAIDDPEGWREWVRDIRAGGTKWWWWRWFCRNVSFLGVFLDQDIFPLSQPFGYFVSSKHLFIWRVFCHGGTWIFYASKAWTAINRLSIIWKSDLTDKMKHSFFQAAIVSILLYGCSTWTPTKRLQKKLDGNYTRMLPAILKKSSRQQPTKHQIYGHLPPITKTIHVRRTRYAEHCWRSRDELITDALLWLSKSRTTT